MKDRRIFCRALAFLAALTVLAVAIPFTGVLTLAGEAEGYTVGADASTAQTFESMLGTDKDGNRYAGRVWVDKSVYTDKQVSLDGFTVTHDEDFLVVYSALGSSGTVTTTKETGSLLDVVLVLDASASVAADNRLEQVVSAADSLLSGLAGGKNRIAVVTYNAKATTVAPLEAYTQLALSVEKTGDGVGVVAKDGNTVVGEIGYTGVGTGTQLGIQCGLELLQQNAVTGRTPVMILLTGGEANVAARDTWTDGNASHSLSDYRGGTTPGVVLSTLLNASYWKSAVEKAYGRKALVYTVSTQVSESQQANTLTIADPENWFTANSASAAGKEAYVWYRTWADSSNAYSVQDAGRVSWTFPQLTTDSLGFPNNEYGVTKRHVMDNIHYVNRHFATDNGGELTAAMDEILTTVSTPSFIPTVDTAVQGDAASSVPVTYVDFIGDYMHVKNIQAVTLFGKQYAVMEAGAETTYSYGEVNTETTVVSYAVGFGAGEIEHPTLGTIFSVSNAVWMELTTEVTGTVDPATGDFEAVGVPRQTLRVFVRSEALPVLLESVSVAVDGTIRYEETVADPLRVYYTVEVNPAILDEEGQVDLSRVDEAYTKANTVDGKVQFYASRFGEMNPAVSGTVTYGDAHVSFQPSRENRYYYHQNSNAVFYDVTDENGKPLVAEENEYGVTYAPHMDGYRYEYMDAAHLFTWQDGRLVEKAIPDDHPLYTYIEFYYPTADGMGELAYMLTFATWGELKNSLTAVELTEGTTPSGQKLFEYIWDESTVVTVEELREYIEANYQPGFDLTRIRARVAAQSLRVSRLNHMIEEKAENITGTAMNAYAPTYNEDTAHVGDIVVWLGNNGVLSTEAEVGITIANTLSAVAPEDTGEAFAFTVSSDTATDTGETIILRHTDATGTESRSTAAFTGGKLTVALRAGESVSLVGLTKGAHYTVQVAENAYYNPVVNGTEGNTVVILAVAGEFMDADFVHTPKKFGNLTINAVVEHPYGIGYVLPEDLTFVVDTHLTLNGKPLANKTFVAEHTGDGTVTSVTTDENGVVRMVLAPNDQVELFGLEAGTVANGTQHYFDGTTYYTYGQVAGKWYPGFGAPIYWDDDGTHDDDQVVVVAGQTVTAGVINTYTPAAASAHIRLEGVKSMVGNWPANAQFTFQLQQYNPLTGSWERVEEIAVTQSAPAIRFDKVFTYTAVGTYSYQVVEVAGDAAGIIYDPIKHNFFVTVTDVDFDGKLEIASVVSDHNKQAFAVQNGVYSNDHLHFTNHYQADVAVAVINLQTVLKNPAFSDRVSSEGFEYALYDGDRILAESGYTNMAGEAQLIWTVEKAGSYNYTLRQKTTYFGETIWGMTYAADIPVTVVVTEDPDGTKQVAMTAPGMQQGELVVENTYTLKPIVIQPETSMALVGATLEEGEFTFLLKQVNVSRNLQYVIDPNGVTTKNTAKGAIPFPSVTFDTVGAYYFEVSQVVGDRPGVTYDSKVYHVAVFISDKGDGTLAAEQLIYDYPDNIQVGFTNVYTARPVELVIEAETTLAGKALNKGEFLFALVSQTDPAQSVTVGNEADSRIVFPALTFTETGTYTYVLYEVDTHREEITYDGSRYTLTVEISDRRSGQLEAAVTAIVDEDGQVVAYEDMTFANHYEANGQLTLVGKKYLDGGNLKGGDFNFTLFVADEQGNRGEALSTVHNDAEGNFRFVLEYTENHVGVHYYLVEEMPRSPYVETLNSIVEPDIRQYLVKVTVNDDVHGHLVAEATITRLGSGDTYTRLVFINTVTDKPVPELEYGMTQAVNDGKPTADPVTVYPGDRITYYITVKNMGDHPVEALGVGSRIPEGLQIQSINDDKYMEYRDTVEWTDVDGYIHWDMVRPLEVGETLTVFFTAEVAEVMEKVTVTNRATVFCDKTIGKIEQTNEVVLHVLPASEGPATSPETGDVSLLPLWLGMLFVSGGVALWMATTRKKARNRS